MCLSAWPILPDNAGGRRISQIRNMQEAVAVQMALPVFDFVKPLAPFLSEISVADTLMMVGAYMGRLAALARQSAS
jgi:hypothetical protein